MSGLKKLVATLAVIPLSSVLAFGCGPASDDPDRRSTMTVLSENSDIYAIRLGKGRQLLFLPLVNRYGPEARPRLAESWERSPDYRMWTFHLRKDVRWHDGVPVTAHDVAFSLELFVHSDVLYPTWLAGPRVDSISVPDDHTITLFLNQPASRRMLSGWTVFFPRHLLQDLDPAGFGGWDFWTRPIGNGPYRFVRRVPKTMLELEANPDFYAGEPAIKRVVIKFGGANPVIELTSGAADVAFELGLAEVSRFKTDAEFVVYYEYDWSELQAIYWNQRHPLFADAAVRRALSHAIDRRELARLLNLPEEMPLIGGVSDWHRADEPYRSEGWDQGPGYDLETAARLLEQAGWVDHDGDGIRELASREARFTLSVRSGTYIPGVQLGLYIQDQLHRVGVATEIRPLDRLVLQEVFKAGDFDAAINWFHNDRGAVEDLFGPPGFGYHDAEALRLLQALHATPDPDAQDTLYARINEVLRRDMPITFLFPLVLNHVAHRRIRGLRQGWGLLSYAEELWIEEDEP